MALIKAHTRKLKSGKVVKVRAYPRSKISKDWPTGVSDYQITSHKPKGYGTIREGYKSSRTGKYHSWVQR